MHSIFGFMQRGKGKSPQGPGVQDRRPVVGDGYEQRPDFDANAYRKKQNSDAMRRKALSARGRTASDPRDTPKYGVEASRPYSTKSKHGTGRGSSAGGW